VGAPALDEVLEPQGSEREMPSPDDDLAALEEAEVVAESQLDEAPELEAVEPETPQMDAAFAEPAEVEAAAAPALAESDIPELTELESAPEASGIGAAELALGAGALAAAGVALAAGTEPTAGEGEQEPAPEAPAARGVEVLKVSEVASAAAAAAMMAPQAVNAPPGTVAVIDEQALLQSMYEKMLPRMKVELSLWLQDALELQAKQMLSGVMHQLKEDYEMLFGEALKESLRQTINSLGKIEKDGKRDE